MRKRPGRAARSRPQPQRQPHVRDAASGRRPGQAQGQPGYLRRTAPPLVGLAGPSCTARGAQLVCLTRADADPASPDRTRLAPASPQSQLARAGSRRPTSCAAAVRPQCGRQTRSPAPPGSRSPISRGHVGQRSRYPGQRGRVHCWSEVHHVSYWAESPNHSLRSDLGSAWTIVATGRHGRPLGPPGTGAGPSWPTVGAPRWFRFNTST